MLKSYHLLSHAASTICAEYSRCLSVIASMIPASRKTAEAIILPPIRLAIFCEKERCFWNLTPDTQLVVRTSNMNSFWWFERPASAFVLGFTFDIVHTLASCDDEVYRLCRVVRKSSAAVQNYDEKEQAPHGDLPCC